MPNYLRFSSRGQIEGIAFRQIQQGVAVGRRKVRKVNCLRVEGKRNGKNPDGHVGQNFGCGLGFGRREWARSGGRRRREREEWGQFGEGASRNTTGRVSR